MKQIILISCVSKKKEYETIASEMYESTLFKLSLQYAKTLDFDKKYILSALYGLLELSDVINPYDLTLNNMKSKDRVIWADKVLQQLADKKIDLNNTEFIFLAGSKYRENLIKHMKNYKIPLEGLRIGEQLSYLKRELNHE